MNSKSSVCLLVVKVNKKPFHYQILEMRQLLCADVTRLLSGQQHYVVKLS